MVSPNKIQPLFMPNAKDLALETRVYLIYEEWTDGMEYQLTKIAKSHIMAVAKL